MKKAIILLFVLPFFIEAASAQGNDEFSKGNHVINLGVGIGTYRSFPVTASYEVGIIDGIADKGSIGIGGIFGFRTYTYGTVLGVTTTSTSLVFGLRAAFHYNFVENLDTYAGFITAYSYYTSDSSLNPSAFVPGFFVGARYYFNPTFGVMAEAGYGLSTLNVGVAFRF